VFARGVHQGDFGERGWLVAGGPQVLHDQAGHPRSRWPSEFRPGVIRSGRGR
jgi:hypothetical protein